MATYGLKTYDSSGTVTLDTTDAISRLRYSIEATATVSGNITLSDISGKTTSEFAVCKEQNKTPHLVSRSGTSITWTAESSNFYPSGDSLVLIFLYD
uniref:Tail protein n=1 Tax=viral metagenome TaxID=1070528 RepID=A0A6M3KZR7_9ZZZZ